MAEIAQLVFCWLLGGETCTWRKMDNILSVEIVKEKVLLIVAGLM